MFKNKYEPVLVPVYISLKAKVIVYRDINNLCFVYERISPDKERGEVSLIENYDVKN